MRGLVAVQVADLAPADLEGELTAQAWAYLYAGPGGHFLGDPFARCLPLAHCSSSVR
jgi:hypothetical protein